MTDPDEVFSDRRAREETRRMDEKMAERAKAAAEEAARRERAPVPTGLGRVFKG